MKTLTTFTVVLIIAMMSALILPMHDEPISPAPDQLAQWLRMEDQAQRPYDHWNYQRSGRTPSRSMLAKVMTGSGAISLSGTAVKLAPGATGTDLTLSSTLTVNGTGTSLFASGTMAWTAASPSLYASQATGPINWTSAISALNAGATSGTSMFAVFPQSALDATDYVFSVGNAANATSVFSATYAGLVNAAAGYKINGSGGAYTGALAGVVTAGGYWQGSTIADSAGNSLNDFGNVGALTSGVDRYAARFYRDNASNVAARIFTDGTYQNLATVGTVASGTGITATYSGAVRQWVHKVVVTNAAMAAAATTDITLAVTPVNSRVVRVLSEVTQVFSGGALSAVAVVCGRTAGAAEFLASHSQLAAPIAFGDVVGEMGAAVVDSTRADFSTTVTAGVPQALSVICRYSCTGANCNAATQGSTTYYVEGVTY